MGTNRSVLALFALATLLLYSPAALGQSAKIKKIDDYVKPFAEAGHFSGVILVADDGDIIYEKAFGTANADFTISNQVDTRIGIASITKPMTVVILLNLIAEKKIAPDDKLAKYISDFPNGDAITVEMLARHRSGIPHRVMDPAMESVPYTSTEMVEKIKQAKLAFQPGTDRLYSSAGYTVLARVLEIASGKSYAQLLEKYVFEPAGMKDSIDYDGVAITKRLAKDYLLSPSGFINASLKDYSFLVGAGSVVSTARDIYRFGDAVVAGRFGDAVRSELASDNTFTSNGSTNGHRAYLKVDGKNSYGFVVLSNLGSGANDVIIDGLERIAKGENVPAPQVPSPKIVALSHKSAGELFGTYRREGASSGGFDVTLKDDQLFAGDIRLYPIGKDCFFDYKFYGEVCFVRDATGKVNRITWASPGVTSIWIKQ